MYILKSITYEMLACYGIPCSFTKVLKTHKSIVWYYVQNAVSRGILNLVLWSKDIVPLVEMMTRSRASSVVVPVGCCLVCGGVFGGGGGGGGVQIRFLFWQILYVGPVAVAVVLCAGVS